MAHYKTIQGEMLDRICRKIYGDESGYVEAVLEANPGLAKKGEPLPFGTLIMLPEVEKNNELNLVYLWD
ncbi:MULTISPECIES: tail protein X [unclassified Bartonella]|uniref:tail protein X n=1 Tax=unclassified Bartonella TaxID=2645622 RepID=UPI0015FD4E50|nr:MULTISPECIES: tail protein X [unclassified Bartonella]UXM94330.1 tail protein X [Bartonella sp. HY329]UXN05270.1 tail protein X [Bartonella sp. HY761]UXN08653.1 tail protein X [Bartonella sp. HY328]